MCFSKLPVTVILVLAVAMVGCGAREPITPNLEGQEWSENASGHVLLGLYEVWIDLSDGTTWVEPARSAGGHFNVTEFLFPPYCSDCFRIEVTEFDWDNFRVTADVTVKNFTKGLTGYDVRGIVYTVSDFTLLNPYAYTLLHAPPTVIDPCGFRAFDVSDPDRAMGPEESATETFEIGFEPDPHFLKMVYAIDASWPDHCPEPYDIYGFEQSPLSIEPAAGAQVTVYVSDWQEDNMITAIKTDAFGAGDVLLEHQSGDLWTGTIQNTVGMPVGAYPSLITAMNSPLGYHLYQWVMVEVVDLTDQEPPTWDDEEGITEVWPGLEGILIYFGYAGDPSEPVTYNLYWAEGDTLDFDSANLVTGIETSPYLLLGLSPGVHTLCVRAEDDVGNETENTDFESAVVGEHPGVYWTEGPSMSQPRGYLGAFLAEGYLWVLGGSSAGTQLDAVERYNLTTGEWDSPWSLPAPRDAFGCGAIDGKAYVFGGRFAETDVTDTCEVIDLATGEPDLVAITMPAARATMGCAILDGTFYLAGGRTFSGTQWVFHREAYSFTPPGPDFEGETDLEFDTSTMGFAAGEGYLMSVGGHPDREDVLYHEPGTKSWQWRAPIIPGRDGNVSVWVDGWLYSIGGNVGPAIITNVDVMDVEGDTWYSISPLIHRRGVPAAATDGSDIYVIGGLDTVGPAALPLASLEIGEIF